MSELHVIIRFTITQIINTGLGLIGANRINNFSQLMSWILLLQAMLNLPILWHASCEHWEKKNELFKLVEHVKTRHSIYLLKCKLLAYLLRLAKYYLYQVQKPIASNEELTCSLALQKSLEKYKQEGKK